MKALRHTLIPLGIFIGLLGFVVSCTTPRPLSPARTLDAYLVEDIHIIVPEPYSFRRGFLTDTLPAGTYVPAMEDDYGVYFFSPRELLIGGLLGPTPQDGGLYFEHGSSTNCYEYVIDSNRGNDRPLRWKLPSDFKFRIERKP